MGRHPRMLSKFLSQMSDQGTKWVMYKLGCPFSLKDKNDRNQDMNKAFSFDKQISATCALQALLRLDMERLHKKTQFMPLSLSSQNQNHKSVAPV